jgi:epoxyqueuosine reductase
MKPPEITNSILSFTEKQGYIAKVVAVEHLKELEDELILRKRIDDFDEAFYQERLTSFKFTLTTALLESGSIIIIAVPQPKVLLIFSWQGENYPVFIPPTYDISINEEIKRELEEILIPEGFTAESTVLPLKLLAVRCGLAEYGRNNICYVPGKGSFYRLMAFFSNLPCLEDLWRPVCMMNRCNSCKACIMACPTGAINGRRFLLHAELCLSFHNEHSGDFPDIINPSVHHCLFGCMRCQDVCPENKNKLSWIEVKETFSEYETTFILNNNPFIEIPSSTRNKLEKLCLLDDYPLLSRNLSFVLKQKNRCT